MDAMDVWKTPDILGFSTGKHGSNNDHYQFWLQHNKPIELLDPEMTMQKLNYIHDNPIEAGFVENSCE